MPARVNIWVNIDRCDTARMYSIRQETIYTHIPRIRLFIDAHNAGTQHEFVQDIRGYQRGTLQESFGELLNLLRLFGQTGRLDLFDEQQRVFEMAVSEPGKRRFLEEWRVTLCDMCDILDHDNYLRCSNFLFEHLLPSFELVFPELQRREMQEEMIELFYSLARVFRGHKQAYLNRLHRIWRRLDGQLRSTILNRIRIERHVEGHGRALDRMHFALENPREPTNLAQFGDI